MPDYWLDSSIYIRSRGGVLALDIAPRFWSHLVRLASTGRISSPVEVRDELLRHSDAGDPFNAWVMRHRNSLFASADATVEQQKWLVDEYVNRRYIQTHAARFRRGADPWLIAYAIASGGSIVTNETLTVEPGPNRNTGLIDTKPQIPNVARNFGATVASLPTMLRALGVNDL